MSIFSENLIPAQPRQSSERNTALLLDENPESRTLISESLIQSGLDVIIPDDYGDQSMPDAATIGALSLIVCSRTLPSSANRSITDSIASFCPIVPVILLDSHLAGSEDLGFLLVRAQLSRPVDSAALEAAIQTCRQLDLAIRETIERSVFLRYVEYIEEPIARIIHDLNNQMTGLKGGIDLMSYSVDMIREPDTQAKFTRYMEQFIRPSLAQIEQMVANWRHLRENRIRPTRTSDLKAILHEASLLCCNPYQQKRLVFRLLGETVSLHALPALKTTRIEIQASPEQLSLALGSILQNAIEATEDKPDGAVLVEVELPAETTCLIRVLDNGDGIPEPLRPQIWRSFFTTKGEWRNGLGLSIAKQIIDKHQGLIECMDSPMGGAGIQISLPLYSA